MKAKCLEATKRKLVGLAWIAERWGCSRQTCRRILQREGAAVLYLGGGARNATLRFDLVDVVRIEDAAQVGGGSRGVGGGR
jgi:hypothetical protein